VIEVKDRKTGERTDVPLASAVDHLRMCCEAKSQRSEALLHS